jgi:metal-responsive CopG/Arc/MetJ family transcriptional regulator
MDPKKKKAISVTMDKNILASLDERRSLIPRSTFIEELVRQFLSSGREIKPKGGS